MRIESHKLKKSRKRLVKQESEFMLDEPSPQKKIEKTPKIQKEKEDAFPTKSVENLAKIEEDRLVIID
jgi:hypothetical protein